MSDDGNRRVLAEDNTGILYDDPNKSKVFSDGVAQFTLGPAVSKITFFQVETVEMKGSASFESRKVNIEVTLPTIQMVTFLSSAIDNLATMFPLVDSANSSAMSALRELANRFQK
jgi:hypothetical protein